MLTASATKDGIIAAPKLGVRDYVLKPHIKLSSHHRRVENRLSDIDPAMAKNSTSSDALLTGRRATSSGAAAAASLFAAPPGGKSTVELLNETTGGLRQICPLR